MVSLRNLILLCKLKAEADGKTLRAILVGICLRQFEVSIESGRMVVSTAEAGGATQFSEVTGMTSPQLIAMATAGIEWLDRQQNETPSGLPSPVRRLRPSFGRVML